MVIPSEERHEGHITEEGEGEELEGGNHHHNPLHHTTDQFHHKFGVPGKEEGYPDFLLQLCGTLSKILTTTTKTLTIPLPLLSSPDVIQTKPNLAHTLIESQLPLSSHISHPPLYLMSLISPFFRSISFEFLSTPH